MTEIVKPEQKHSLGTVSKYLLGEVAEGGLNRFYVATTVALISAVVYTSHLFSMREGLENPSVQTHRESNDRCNQTIVVT